MLMVQANADHVFMLLVLIMLVMLIMLAIHVD